MMARKISKNMINVRFSRRTRFSYYQSVCIHWLVKRASVNDQYSVLTDIVCSVDETGLCLVVNKRYNNIAYNNGHLEFDCIKKKINQINFYLSRNLSYRNSAVYK